MLAAQSVLPAVVLRLSRRGKAAILLAVDAALAVLSLSIASGAAQGAWPAPAQLAVTALAAGLFSAASGLHRIKLNAFRGGALRRSAAAAGGTALALWAAGAVPGFVIVQFALMQFLLSVATRAAMRAVLIRILRMGQPCARVMIYGAGRAGQQIAAALDGDARMRVVAFVDDSPAVQGLIVAGLRVYAADRITALARQLQADRVLLAMPAAPPDRLARIERHLRDIGLDVQRVAPLDRLAAPSPAPAGQFLGRSPVEVEGGAAAYAGRVVMVTGAGGSVGAELCRQVIAMGPARLVLFDLCEFALYAIDRELRESGSQVEVVPVLGSVADARLVRSVIAAQAVTVVLHAAAYKHVPLVEANPLAGIANNVLGTRTLAEAAVACGVRRFVLISTDKAVRAEGMMGATKRAAEIVVQDMARRAPGTGFAIVRFGNVLGSSGSVIPLFREQIARGGPVTLTHEAVTRYFMTLAEAARLVLLAGSFGDAAPRRCDVFVLDMGAPVRIRDLAAQMIAAAGYTLRDDAHPDGDIEIVVTGLRPGEKLHEELLIADGLLPTPHPRILRAEERGPSEWQVAAMLHELGRALRDGDAAMARAVVFDHVEPARAAAIAVAAE